MDTITLSRELAVERAMRHVQVKPGSEGIARLAIEAEVKAHQETYPEIFDPADESMLSQVGANAVKKSPTLFAGAEKSGSGAANSLADRAAQLRRMRS
jgi:hypothetical protein